MFLECKINGTGEIKMREAFIQIKGNDKSKQRWVYGTIMGSYTKMTPNA